MKRDRTYVGVFFANGELCDVGECNIYGVFRGSFGKIGELLGI